MADVRSPSRYRVVNYRGPDEDIGICTVQFLEELEPSYVCSWCGGASKCGMYVLSCLHAFCKYCEEEAFRASTPVCPIDRKKLSYTVKWYVPTDLDSKKVRCLYADGGCDFTGELGKLNDHLRGNCSFHLTTCFKCGDSVARKDIRGHCVACKGVAGVFFRAEDAQSLVEDFDSARREVEKALTLKSADDLSVLRNAVNSVSEGLARLRCQPSEGVLGQFTADRRGGPAG